MSVLRKAANNLWLATASRLLLGIILFSSAIGKLENPKLFTETVVEYGLLPHSLAQAYGTVLPWAELVVSLALLLGIFVRLASLLTILMSASFAVAGIYALFRPAVDMCGCFGELVNLSHGQAIALDVFMILLAVQLVYYSSRAEILGVGYVLRRGLPNLAETARPPLKMGVLGVAALVAGLLITGAGAGVDPPDSKPEFFTFFTCLDCYDRDVPLIERLEAEYGDRIDFRWINTIEEKEIAEHFDVSGPFTWLLVTDRGAEDEIIHFTRMGNVDDVFIREEFDKLLAALATGEAG